MPVGRCRNCTHEEVLLIFCPPAPLPRINFSSRSLSRTPYFCISRKRASCLAGDTEKVGILEMISEIETEVWSVQIGAGNPDILKAQLRCHTNTLLYAKFITTHRLSRQTTIGTCKRINAKVGAIGRPQKLISTPGI